MREEASPWAVAKLRRRQPWTILVTEGEEGAGGTTREREEQVLLRCTGDHPRMSFKLLKLGVEEAKAGRLSLGYLTNPGQALESAPPPPRLLSC